MRKNSNLLAAKRAKNDEFYTQYNDIANELSHYREQLQGKRILCNCDFDASNPLGKWEVYNEKEGLILPEGFTHTECNFIQYFIDKITLDKKNGTKEWAIKSLTATGINPVTGYGLRFEDVDYSNYDVVITNPPFSLFGDFINVMMKNNMKFIVLGNINAVIRKDFFPLIKDNIVRVGYSFNKNMKFKVPEHYKNEDGYATVSGLAWYTNFDTSKKNSKLILNNDYNLEDYPKYDNIDAINVDRTSKIPDYEGVMGVPITFLDKYCPDQFEIIGITQSWDAGQIFINGKKVYTRLIIRKRGENQSHEDN